MGLAEVIEESQSLLRYPELGLEMTIRGYADLERMLG
jgi:hypothetical protein